MTSEQADKLASEWEAYAGYLSKLDIDTLAKLSEASELTKAQSVAMAYLLCARDVREAAQ